MSLLNVDPCHDLHTWDTLAEEYLLTAPDKIYGEDYDEVYGEVEHYETEFAADHLTEVQVLALYDGVPAHLDWMSLAVEDQILDMIAGFRDDIAMNYCDDNGIAWE